jgi:cytochrome c553
MRVALLLVAIAGCTPSYADEPPSKQFEHDMMARFHMHESYTLFGAIERLLVRGKLAEVRDLARAIGVAPDEAGLSAWAAQAAVVRDRAAAVANATTVEVACQRTASLAAACARCHADTGVSPEFRTPPPLPPDRPTIDARMTRHVWAVERVREGVIGDDDSSWRAGIDVLAQAPLPWRGSEGARGALAKQLHDVADRARHRATPDPDRARTYGELLVACAACHATAKLPD